MAILTLEPLDPLSLVIAPPKNEPPADRWAREQREAQARLISEQIDAQIKAEKQASRKRLKPVKILLLGQSESGKSTTVKNFQLAYAYSSFLEERSAWKAVIHLNLIRSVNAILDVLSKEMPRTTSQPQSPLNTPRNRSLSRPSTVRVRSSLSITQPSSTPPSAVHVRSSTSAGSRTSQPSEPTLVEPNNDPDADDDPEDDDDDDDEIDSSAPPLTDRHRMLQLRLAPLRQIQRDLERSLGAASTEAPEFAGEAAPWTRLDDVLGTRGTREFSITSRSGWKKALKRVKAGYSSGRRTSLGSRDEARVGTGSAEDAALRKQPLDKRRSRPQSPFVFDVNMDDEYDDEGECEPQAQSAAEVIASCAEDVAALWSDAGVQAVLSRRKAKARLEEGPGFFLNDVARIAARGYEPSDEDVVRARLRTMGVQEYRFRFERGPDAGRDWLLYDVGGARSLRHAWLPYFDDINALIFLAPISCFDERLAEDRRVNRLQDSILLWKAVCGSKLLQNVQLILFLNKCDLLHKKLSRGVHVAKFVPSYGDKPNDVREVAKYFRHQFKDIFTRYSPEKRPFYAYMTSVTDTKATAVTVATVRDGIHRNSMKGADML